MRILPLYFVLGIIHCIYLTPHPECQLIGITAWISSDWINISGISKQMYRWAEPHGKCAHLSTSNCFCGFRQKTIWIDILIFWNCAKKWKLMFTCYTHKNKVVQSKKKSKNKVTACETLKGDDTRTFPLHTTNLESFLMHLASNHSGRIGSIQSYQGQKSRWCWFQPAKISFIGFGSLVFCSWSTRIYG